MKLTADQKALHAALSAVARIAPTKSTLPILSTVQLQAVDDVLTVACTDLERALCLEVAATVEQSGAVCVDARQLTEWLGYQSGTVSLALEGKRLTARAGRAMAKLATMSADDYPPLPSVEGEPLSLDAATLVEAIEHVLHAAAKDDSRPVLAGVLVRQRDNALTLAAADGFRLAVHTAEVAGPDWQAIVPAASLRELARLLGTAETVNVWQDGGRVTFGLNGARLSSRLIEGQFPDYARIVPTEYTSTLSIVRADLVQAVKAASVFARDNSMICRLSVEGGALLVRTSSAETGEQESSVAAEVVGTPEPFALNATYLLDALGVLDSPTVWLGVTAPNSPVVLKSDREATKYEVVMPMHVAG